MRVRLDLRTIRPRAALTPERLDDVRALNTMGGADMVARALAVSRSQAYRLIAEAEAS